MDKETARLKETGYEREQKDNKELGLDADEVAAAKEESPRDRPRSTEKCAWARLKDKGGVEGEIMTIV